jgi:tetratricopeptide (TPR) repeat protein
MTAAARLAPSGFLVAQAVSAHALHRPRETLKVLDRAESQNRRHDGLAPYWSFKAIAYHEAGQHYHELALARRARLVPSQEMSGLYAEIRALAALRRTHQVLALLDRTLSPPRDPHYSPGGIMLVAAQELRAHGDRAASVIALQRAIHWFRSNPPTQIDALAHSAVLADALYLAGDWDEADALLRRVAKGRPDTQRAWIYGQLGAIAVRSGDLAAARQFLASLDRIEIPTYGPAWEVSLARARITALLGDADGAVRILRQGVGGQGMDLHTDVDFEPLRQHSAFREFTRPKG